MKRVMIFWFALNLFVYNSSGQKTIERYKSKWHVNPSFGYNIGNDMFKGEMTDYLIDFADRSVYWQVIDATFFFSKHWGMEFTFQGSAVKNSGKRTDKFFQQVVNQYPDFDAQRLTTSYFNRFSIIAGDIERGTLGLVYRYEPGRFFIYPKFAVGVTSFYTEYFALILKEKGSNRITRMTYGAERAPHDHFTLATSSAIGYKLSKKVFANIDVGASWFRTDITLLRTMTDVYANNSISETSRYKKHIFSLSGGVGIIYVLR